ncbi:DUF4129 domain-containing protein [Chitinophaga agrisoli]|nr:DUF4129 domain-containing protein [Chitinophaga agrisoli]
MQGSARCWLLLAGLILPMLLLAQSVDSSAALIQQYMDTAAAEDSFYTAAPVEDTAGRHEEQEVKTHYFWDRQRPLNIDSTEEWWSSGSLVERKIPVKIFNQLKADKDLQYHKKAPKEVEAPWLLRALVNVLGFMDSIRVILYIGLGCGLALLIFNFMRQQGFRLFKKQWNETLPDAAAETGGSEGYEKQIQDAIANGRFRMAVRYLHLQALYVMAARQLITLGKDKTNADYLRGLLKTPWYQPFARLTRDYEYIWYGEMPVNTEQFDQIHGQFRQFMRSVDNQ